MKNSAMTEWLEKEIRELQKQFDGEKTRKQMADEFTKGTQRAARSRHLADSMMALLGRYIADVCRDEAYAAMIEGAFATNICLMEVTPECDALDKIALEARMRTASLEAATKTTVAESEAFKKMQAGNEPAPNPATYTKFNPTVTTTPEGAAGAMNTQTITIGTPPVSGKPSGWQHR